MRAREGLNAIFGKQNPAISVGTGDSCIAASGRKSLKARRDAPGFPSLAMVETTSSLFVPRSISSSRLHPGRTVPWATSHRPNTPIAAFPGRNEAGTLRYAEGLAPRLVPPPSPIGSNIIGTFPIDG